MAQAKKVHIQLLIQAQTPTLPLSKPQIFPFVVNVPNKESLDDYHDHKRNNRRGPVLLVGLQGSCILFCILHP
jgi:hypothetical protein